MVTRHEKEEDFKYFFQSIKNLHKTLFNTEYEPTGLVADNAEAISNAFRATFSSDRNLWESSICSCYYWLKNRKCYHVVAAAYRVKLCNFSDICMDQLIEPNRKRGAPEKNKPALMIQPSDSNATRPKKDLLVEGALSEDEDEDDVPLVNLAKRRTAAIANTKSAASETTSTTQADKQQKKTALICKICGGAKIMNCRYGTCPNNCKK